MIELHRHVILESRHLPGINPVRHEGPIHKRPRVVDHARIKPGHEGTKYDLQIDKPHEPGRPADPTSVCIVSARIAPQDTKRHPHKGCKDKERQSEMGRKPVLGHADPLRQPGRHHVPAKRTLKTAQDEQPGACPRQLPAQPSRRQEPHEGHKEGQTDEPAEEAVPPFPPVNGLELIKAHALVDQLVLWNLPVLVEFLFPDFSRQRRDCAGHRLPFGNGEA